MCVATSGQPMTGATTDTSASGPAARECLFPECNDKNKRSIDVSISNHYQSASHQRVTARRAKKLYENSRRKSTDDFEENDRSNFSHGDSSIGNVSSTIEDFQRAIDALDQIETIKDQQKVILATVEDGVKIIPVKRLIQSNHLEAMKISQAVIDVDIKSLERKVETIESVTHHSVSDGYMVWKITGVQEKMLDAQSERATSVYSPPFFTSPTGYKLRVRIYLNGDGTARGSHISIFLVIMRGPFDDRLVWPFSFRVAFCLVDQRALLEPEKGNARDIIDCFRPNVQSVSFERPCTEMNIASGIPKFVPLSIFDESMDRNRYRIDDTIFIKTYVDFIDLPKSMIPFIFSLNTGLPTHVREKLIAEERERRQKENIV